MVAETILAGGFNEYYRLRTGTSGQAAPEQNRNSFTRYDDHLYQAEFVRATTSSQTQQDNELEAILVVEDIHCAACCWLIEQALKRLDGLSDVIVNLSTHRVTVYWQPERLLLSTIMQQLQQLGFTAAPYLPHLEQTRTESLNRQQLLRLGVAGICMMQVGMLSIALYAGAFQGIAANHEHFINKLAFFFTLPVVFFAARPFFKGALRSILVARGNLFRLGMDVPISLAIVAAFFSSVATLFTQQGEVYFDSICMFVFLLTLARYLESRARQQQDQQLYQHPVPATCELVSDQQTLTVATTELQNGNHICIKPGATIPADGIVIDGSSTVNEATFSGEQAPQHKRPGDNVYASTLNCDGSLIVEVTHCQQQSRFATINRLMENNRLERPQLTPLIDRIAGFFTFVVLCIAAATAYYWLQQGNPHWLEITLAVLVVSCPCALSLATPSSLAFCHRALRAAGLLVQSPQVIERCTSINHVVFDKTGTLTLGKPHLTQSYFFSERPDNATLELAKALENHSEHPIALAFAHIHTDLVASGVTIETGQGIEGTINQQRYRLGNAAFCATFCHQRQPDITGTNPHGSTVWLVCEQQWLACFFLADSPRPDSAAVIQQLQQQGKRISIMSGDQHDAVVQLATELGIENATANMSPEQKSAALQALQNSGEQVLMVGDGINDMPVLSRADISVAMANASDLAKIGSDSILLVESLQPLLSLFSHSEKTRKVIRQNITWAITYNFTALPLAACGLIPPWLAALGMSASSLLVTANALRLKTINMPRANTTDTTSDNNLRSPMPDRA